MLTQKTLLSGGILARVKIGLQIFWRRSDPIYDMPCVSMPSYASAGEIWGVNSPKYQFVTQICPFAKTCPNGDILARVKIGLQFFFESQTPYYGMHCVCMSSYVSAVEKWRPNSQQ